MPRRHLAVGVVHDARLEAAAGPAEGARVDLARLDAVGEDAPGLRHAPDLHERETEALLEGLVELGLDARRRARSFTWCARSSGAGGWLRRSGGITPR